ncbi:MAG: hypothetical protein KDH20_12900 [Rhodocyclaceae bacterium]|nr:hypothetical protein [Rhodocyclaceae bacterium]
MHTVYGGVGGNKDQPSAPGGDRAITYFDPYRPRAGDKALTYIDPYLPRGSDRALTYIDPYHAQGATTRTAKNPMTQQVLSVVYNPATGQYLDTTARRWLNAPAWMRAQLG